MMEQIPILTTLQQTKVFSFNFSYMLVMVRDNRGPTCYFALNNIIPGCGIMAIAYLNYFGKTMAPQRASRTNRH